MSTRPNVLLILTDQQRFPTPYEESLRVPFVMSSPLIDGGPREINVLTSHADQDTARERLACDHTEARPLVGRDLSAAVLTAQSRRPGRCCSSPTTRSARAARAPRPVVKIAAKLRRCSTVVQPNHLETVIAEVDVDLEQHLVKFSPNFDNEQFWMVPGERDERLAGRKTLTVTEPEPDEYELYDVTADPLEQRNLAHPKHATDASRRLQHEMLDLLVVQLDAKRLVPGSGAVSGYRPPVTA